VAPALSSLLNKTILVAIPALFADAHACSCRLVSLEAHGLWLVSDELSRKVLGEGKRKKDTVISAIFVPFAQIAAIIPVAQAAVGTAGLRPAAAATAAPPAPAACAPAAPQTT
jgi:hypothetical protein